MKVLHISTMDYGGAGLCTYRLSQSVRKYGVDSQMLVLYKSSDAPNVHQVKSMRLLVHKAIDKALRMLGFAVTERNVLIRQSKNYHSSYTSPVTSLDISSHPLVKQADLIHLHWVNDFFNQPLFFQKVNKPIVWTVHDENLFYGTSHFHDSILADDPLEQKYFHIKHQMISKARNLSIVLLSKHFLRTFSDDSMLVGKNVRVINNSVDCDRFVPVDKNVARERLGISQSKIFLLFIAVDITMHHKGLDTLIEAVDKIGGDDIRILAVGDDSRFTPHPLVITTGMVRDTAEMSNIISACDYFVMPSLQEAFAQTPIEAMACGKPAVVFPVSGTEELINENNGVRCTNFTVDSLVEGLYMAFSHTYDSKAIRTYVCRRFAPDVIARQYVELYEEMMNSQKR